MTTTENATENRTETRAATVRKEFHDFLLSHMVEGVHFGYPPGTKPKLDDDGNILQWKKPRNEREKGRWETVPKSEWQAKPSLYKAGAALVCSLMNARPVWHYDEIGAAVLQNKPGVFVFRCDIHEDDANGPKLCEGRGIVDVQTVMGRSYNTAIKLAQKRSFVDAVINTYSLADLFTQDLDDPDPETPEETPPANVPAPRDDRITEEELRNLFDVGKQTLKCESADEFKAWVVKVTGRDFSIGQVAQWRRDEYDKCLAKLEEVTNG